MADSSLFVVAYPEISTQDRAWIEDIRRDSDPNACRIAAHFTLAFAIEGISAEDIRDHLRSFARNESQIAFTCRHVMIGQDHAKPLFHVFLVPEEGFAAINLLRERPHHGVLHDHLRPEIPYTPHITLGAGADAGAIRDQCRALNDQRSLVRGVLCALTLVEATAETVREIESLPLSAVKT